jgi:hypothetical protein
VSEIITTREMPRYRDDGQQDRRTYGTLSSSMRLRSEVPLARSSSWPTKSSIHCGLSRSGKGRRFSLCAFRSSAGWPVSRGDTDVERFRRVSSVGQVDGTRSAVGDECVASRCLPLGLSNGRSSMLPKARGNEKKKRGKLPSPTSYLVLDVCSRIDPWRTRNACRTQR